jgi:hypothetical protein
MQIKKKCSESQESQSNFINSIYRSYNWKHQQKEGEDGGGREREEGILTFESLKNVYMLFIDVILH